MATLYGEDFTPPNYTCTRQAGAILQSLRHLQAHLGIASIDREFGRWMLTK
jgi:hypothetical protein